jgi:hypothetical protein
MGFASANASWLSKITGIDINVPAGTLRVSTPQPQAIPEMIQHLPQDAANFFLNPLGPNLAFLIRQARAQANASAQPVPDAVKAALAPYFPTYVFTRARFTTRSRAGVSLATQTLEVNDNIAAMTVDDIIVFRDDNETQQLGTWAHELVHIIQYHNMGVDGFAAIYASPGARNLEQDAYSWQDHVVADLNAGGAPNQQWTDARQGASPPFSWNDFNAAANQLIPPSQCGQWQQVAFNAIQIVNVCPVGLVVTAIQLDGVNRPCLGPICNYPPGENHVIAGAAGQIQSIWFRFVQ